MKKQHYLFLFIIIVFSLSARVQARSFVVISEIMYDSPLNEVISKPPYSNGEYIELYNSGENTVDLSGWLLQGGGVSETFYFSSGNTIAPQERLLVAYRHYNTPQWTLESLYTIADGSNIVYQRKIILANGGESISLFDNNGEKKDSIYYDGTKNKTKPDRLSAENSAGIQGSLCKSLQRITATFDTNECAITNNAEWQTDYVTPMALPLGFNPPEIPLPACPPINENYVMTVTPLSEMSEVEILSNGRVNLSANDKALVEIQYYDGLGRPTWHVQKGITPSGQDLISQIDYDYAGFIKKRWLATPVADARNVIEGVSSFESLAKDFYDDNRPFHYTHYNSYLSLYYPTYEQQEGEAWGDKKICHKNDSVDNNEVKRFQIGINRLIGKGYYAPKTIYRKKLSDEDNKMVIEYIDRTGRTVMTRSADDVDTYYVYNDLGQLCYVLPPLAADALSGTGSYDDNNDALRKYAYVYKYDERGNQVYKRLPGCEPIHMVYDKANRLVLSQDGNQREQEQWMVNKYDRLGRLLYSGLLNRAINIVEQDALCDVVVTEMPSNSGWGYTSSHIAGEVLPLTVNYYDTYAFLDLHDEALASEGCNAKGLLTGTRTYDLNLHGAYTATAYYYDERGRTVETRSTNHMGGTDIVHTEYDFVGNVLETTSTHSTSDSTYLGSVKEHYTYTYDHANRPLVTSYKLNDAASVVLSSNVYDELGRLVEKKRHNNAQTERFAYNIRNQPTRIESGGFVEELYYTSVPSYMQSFAIPSYNGNITAYTWTYGNETNGYNCNYDVLNRYWGGYAYKNGILQVDGQYKEQFSYDKMGNIRQLTRYTYDDTVDWLSYSYNGNQVVRITDACSSRNEYDVKEYVDASDEDIDFGYDANGNMVYDLDRGISAIRYNCLNLPDTIQFDNGNQIIHHYDALGTKLGSRYYTCRTTTVVPIGVVVENNAVNSYVSGTDYAGSVEYTVWGNDNRSVNRIQNSEGYSLFLSPVEHYQFYYCRDHLGNNREVWCSVDGSTIQRTQYYPSGLPWDEGEGKSEQPYKYNGKEFVEMHGWDTYEYGARGYYPAMGRFTVVDPLAEKYYSVSPYAYCGGNPISRIDIDGREWYDIHGNVIDDHQDIQAYIFYDPESFSSQSKQMQKDAVEKYGEGSVAMSNVTTVNEFMQDWKDMASDNIMEVNLNYHGNNQTVTLDSDENEYITATGDGKSNKSGTPSENIQDLPTPLGKIKNAQLNLNTCHSNSRTQYELKGTKETLMEAFYNSFNFRTVRGTDKGVSYWNWFSPNRPHPQDDSAWHYFRRSQP